MQSFLRDRYGVALWRDVARAAGAGDAVLSDGFDAFGRYDAGLAARLVQAAAQATGHEAEALLEDLGTYLVSHPTCEGVRRLLRFGGPDFAAFLIGLAELPDRVRLAVPDLDLPPIQVQRGDGVLWVGVTGGWPEFLPVLTGLLRAVADDYGTLAVLSREEGRIALRLVEAEFAEGRRFALAG